jgi:hypothetical protein
MYTCENLMQEVKKMKLTVDIHVSPYTKLHVSS